MVKTISTINQAIALCAKLETMSDEGAMIHCLDWRVIQQAMREAAQTIRETTVSETAQSTGRSERELFDAWLAATYDSDAEFDEARNCYKEFVVHMAWQAFRGARSLPSATPRIRADELLRDWLALIRDPKALPEGQVMVLERATAKYLGEFDKEPQRG